MEAPRATGSRLGVVAGSGVPTSLSGNRPPGPVTTDWGSAWVTDADDVTIVWRHGDPHVLPHLIDHRANIAALAAAGCDRVLALGSVGSLRPDWPVGTVVVPDDFFAPWVTPSYFDDARGHQVPGFDPAWRSTVVTTWRASTPTVILDGGVYAQATGPRFETPAEIRFLATVADVVGMTVAAETVLAREAGLAYAVVCVVDNLANGVDDRLLTAEQFQAGVQANRRRLLTDLEVVLAALVL